MNTKYKKMLTKTALLLIAAMVLPFFGCTADITGAHGVLAAMADSTGYYGNTFGNGEVIDIIIESDDLILQNNEKANDSYSHAVITVNGSTLYDVGVRLNKADRKEPSLMIVSTDAFSPGQSFKGLDSFIIVAHGNDLSYMRQFMFYAASAAVGAPTPFVAYTNLTVNGRPEGLYLFTEAIGEGFLDRYSFSKDATVFYASEGCPLLSEDDTKGIEVVYPSKTYGTDATDAIKELIKALNYNGDDFPEQIEKILDVNSILRAAAVNYVVGNYDSYSGALAGNYYLIYSSKKFTYVGAASPTAFGLSCDSVLSGDSAPTLKSPLCGVSPEERPLIGRLLDVPEYYERYLGYIKILADYFSNFEPTAKSIAATILPHIEAAKKTVLSKEDYYSNIASNPPVVTGGRSNAETSFYDSEKATDDKSADTSDFTPQDSEFGKNHRTVPIVDYIKEKLEKINSSLPSGKETTR